MTDFMSPSKISYLLKIPFVMKVGERVDVTYRSI